MYIMEAGFGAGEKTVQTLRLNLFEKTAPLAVVEARGSASIFPHGHDFTEIVYVEKGAALHVIDGVTQRIGPGDMFVIPVGHEHRILPAEDTVNFEEEFQIVNILFDARRTGVDAAGFFGGVFSARREESAAQAVDMIRREYEKRLPGWEDIAISALGILVGVLARLDERRERPPAQEIDMKNRYVSEAVKFFAEHYAERITVGDVAAHVGLSRGYLQRLFKEDTGQTISHSIASLRVQHACELLISTDLSVYEIASQVGFSDANQFHIAFKAFVGVTPKTYRAANSVRVQCQHEVI